MAEEKRITCINKNDRQDPTERITHVGGSETLATEWKWTLDKAISFIDDGGKLYVSVGGKRVDVFSKEGPSGRRYLTTARDDTEDNNLLSLDDCP